MEHYTSFDPRLGPIHEDDLHLWDRPNPLHKATVLNDIAEIPETNADSTIQKQSQTTYESGQSELEPIMRPSDTDTFGSLFRCHWLEVCIYSGVFGSFGMSVAFLGPTLLDLGCQTTTDLKHMSWVFFIQLLLTLIGSLSAGYLVKFMSANLLLIFTTLGIPVMFFILPSCEVTSTLLVCLAVMGWCMGCVDSIANLQMIKIFGAKVTPFLQLMYFCYGLGAFLSPMIAEPFLLNNDCSPFIDGVEKNYKISELEKSANVTLTRPYPDTINISRHGEIVQYEIMNFTDSHITTSGPGEVVVSVPPDLFLLYRAKIKTGVRFAFYILGGLQVPMPFIVLFLYMRLKRLDEPFRIQGHEMTNDNNRYGSLSNTADDKVEEESHSNSCYAFQSREIMAICLFASMMLMMVNGVESSYGGFVYTYSIKRIVGMEKREGATINACYWGLFAFGRLLSVFLCTRLTSAFMLLGNIIGCTASLLLLLLFNTSHIMIYLGTSLFGLFLSSCAPSIFALVEQYIDVESSVTSLLVVCAAGGEMIFPLIIGNLFVPLGPLSLLIVCLIIFVTTFFLLICLRSVGIRTTKWKDSGISSFVWLPGYESSDDPERSVITLAASYVRMNEDCTRDPTAYEMGDVDKGLAGHQR